MHAGSSAGSLPYPGFPPRWLLSKGYYGEQIILAGDSAGGGLAMALCMYLRDHNMPVPGGIIAMSPWTDLTASGESYETNYEKDPLFGNTKESLIYQNFFSSFPEEHATSTRLIVTTPWLKRP